ncbi:MAG: FAD:protein FMN transferase [Kiritimatiellae bacterium]|nr:FAD:protein FMN transferase [Kiritimatiellia bacterium]MDD5522120.1 FAD:protein FMN transferase [Kiritimatiellia bacterium]
MTTFFEVIIPGDNAVYAGQAANAAFREIDRLEGLLSRFDPCSDISQVNRLKPGQSVRVAPDVFECLSVAAWAYAETGGAFDVTVAPVLCFQKDVKKSATIGGSEFESARRRIGMRRLQLDDSDFSVGIRADAEGGVEIDLGGVGKGYALDKMADILEEWELANYLLNGGFSTALASGDGDGDGGWLVGVGGQWGKAAGIENIRLFNEALNGSGTEVKGAHIVDPATGLSAKAHLAAWSICPSATAGDALSTAFMIMPTEKIKILCSATEGTGAFVVEPDGSLVTVEKRKEQ